MKTWLLNGTRPQQKPSDGSENNIAMYNIFPYLVVEKNVLCRKWIDETKKETMQIVLPTFATDQKS